MKNLYLNIIEAFKNNRERFMEEGLLPFEVIDLYDGQPEEPNYFEFTAPALFVDYRIEWERGASLRKKGVIEVEAHVLTQPGFGTENINPHIREGLNKLRYYELVAEIMENVATDNIQNLAMIAEEPAKTDYFCYHILRFNTAIYRERGPKHTLLADVKPNIIMKHG